MVAWVGERVREGYQGAGHCALVALDATQRILTKCDQSSDLLKLFLRAAEVADGALGYSVVRAFYPFIHAARDITGFVSARNIFGKAWSITSGKDAWENPMGVRGAVVAQDRPRRNICALAKSIALAASDVCSTVRWFVTIGVLSDIVDRMKIHVEVFGKSFSFNAIRTISAVGGIVGCTFAIAEDVRQIVWGGFRVPKGLDIAYRISLIVGIVLTNYVAGTTAVLFGLGFLGIGCVVSLAKFLVEEENIGQIRVGRPLPNAGAV